MRNAPHVLLIGATGRALGKTEFACAVIRQKSAANVVVGAKITTVKDREGGCPRGGRGCGACGSLQGGVCLIEEHERGTGKDTSRMLDAGAKQAYWLRAHQDHLADGIERLLGTIPPSALVVCESNSARSVLVPGAFVVIGDKGESFIKESCANVLPEADRVIAFDGHGWDFAPERCRVAKGRWTVPVAATGVVLAGGESRRMGRNKGFLPYRGTTLIEYVLSQLRPLVDELVVGANDRSTYEPLGVRVIPDEVPGQGPLMGIVSCLRAATHETILATACDIPELPTDVLRSMLRAVGGDRRGDVVMSSTDEGGFQPLPVALHRRVLPIAGEILESGARRLSALCHRPELRVLHLPPTNVDWYRNVNTPRDYRNLLGEGLGASGSRPVVEQNLQTLQTEKTEP